MYRVAHEPWGRTLQLLQLHLRLQRKGKCMSSPPVSWANEGRICLILHPPSAPPSPSPPLPLFSSPSPSPYRCLTATKQILMPPPSSPHANSHLHFPKAAFPISSHSSPSDVLQFYYRCIAALLTQPSPAPVSVCIHTALFAPPVLPVAHRVLVLFLATKERMQITEIFTVNLALCK